ncbi:Kunitz/Bovine pancreatic trypsin inhibitor domain protein [Oesophagostomum dentatum]|uniref:Kunitz/Bovine pancreatic trypsin inhibitor domain protein n=1 Tax=Oesophagostomum dentatum TaxID=61180 RepID=A0A0B1TQY1_OESDE|nr:Kunitz/Bovine pancreatic trypsin inhibitor domain protein [Oesophagostomum dentatum]
MRLLVLVFVLMAIVFALDDICKKELETGPCRALFKKYGYSTKEKKCVEFVYGGCKGNENNFETMEECQKKCS